MLIQSHQHLKDFCETLREVPVLFLDTEFVGEGHYYPQLGAIQVGTDTQAALIDPLAVQDLSPFLSLLANPAIEKVFHAAGQDLAILFRLMGEPVVPVFDVQVVAAMLGYDEQISFLNLVGRITHKHLAKTHGFTDWLRRPLTPGQIEYALDDVRYLAPVYTALREELRATGRLDWAYEEFRKLEDPARYQPADPRELYLKIRGAEHMNGQTLALLRELIAWREETARALDIPTGRIARDEVLVEIARRPRHRVDELKEIRGIQQQQVERFGQGMIDASQRGASAPRPAPKRSTPFPSSLEPAVDFLTLCLRALASEINICPGLVATRGDLSALVLNGEQADVPLMRGWRRTAIGEPLLATLEGKATARIIPGNRRVHLEWHDVAP